MKAVVLIGGKGTRLRPLTYTVPKAMVLLRNQPYIQYMVDTLMAAGLDGAVLSMGYLPSAIQQYFAARDDLGRFSLDYVVEDYPLGTAGGIKNAEDYLDDEGPFVAANGDVLTGVNLAEVIEAHRNSGALATLTLTSVEDPSAYGLVEVDHRLQVKRFVEKPGSEEVHTSLINAGIYVLERDVLKMIPKGREVSIERQIFPELLAAGKLQAYVSSSYWRDIGTPRSYLAASHDVLSGAIGQNARFQYTSVDPSVSIPEDVTVLPPVSIAEGCRVEPGVTIGGRTSMSRGCLIEEGAMVEGSILFEEVRVGKGAIVRNSIIGPGAVVQGGSIVRGLCVLGAGCVLEEGNVLDQGARVNPQARLPKNVISF